MFERAVVSVINSFFGKYIQNLDSSKLSVGIFQGDVELTDLQLKPEALYELRLPVEVKGGYVGKIKLNIPWTKLFSSSWVVTIEDLYVLAGPVIDRPYDPIKEKLHENAVKQKILEAFERSTMKKVVGAVEQAPGFLETLTPYVVNNIQVSISSIHFRYEDTVTNADHPFACGFMLKNLSADSTDSRWRPSILDSTETLLHKLVQMKNLSFYWNPYLPENHLVRSRLNTDGWRNLLKSSLDTHNIFGEDFDFIIKPISAHAKVILNKNGGFKVPKIFSDLSLDDIDIRLSRQQLLNILSLVDSFKMMKVNQKYRKYHPNVPLKVSPRSWWIYAYESVIEERIRPFSWERIQEHRSAYKRYKELYKKHVEFPIDQSFKEKLREVEENLDAFNIFLAREQAKLEFNKMNTEKIAKKEKKQGWISWLFGSEEDVEYENGKTDWFSELSIDEKEQLYRGIGYDENANIYDIPPEYIAYKIQINLKSCYCSLVKYSKKILQMSITHLRSSMEYRSRNDSCRISCNTESFSIAGVSMEHDLIPILTSDIGVYAPSVNQIFTMEFETKPLYVNAEYALKLNVQPVEIVYDEHSISELTAFFQFPNMKVEMKNAAVEGLQQAVQYSRLSLQYAIEQHKTMHISVNMRSPYMVIPEHGSLQRGGNVLVVDFGTLTLESELQPKDVSLESEIFEKWLKDATMSEIESRLYDQFTIKISDVKILLADSGDDWHTSQTQSDSSYHILPSTRMTMALFNSVKPDYKQLPQQKLVTTLPSIKVNISDERLLTLVSFFNHFLLPSSTSMITIVEDSVDGAICSTLPVIDENEIQPEIDVMTLRRLRYSILGRNVIHKSNNTSSGGISPEEYLNRQNSQEYYCSASDHSDEELPLRHKASDIKSVDDHSSASNTISILTRIILNEAVLQLSKKIDKRESPYLMFRINKLYVDGAITAYGMVMNACLGGIELVDKIHVGPSGEYLELICSKSNDNLVSVTYRKTDPKCPDFGVYGYVIQGVQLKMDTIVIFLHQVGITHLNAYMTRLINSINEKKMKSSIHSNISTSDSLDDFNIMQPLTRMVSITEKTTQVPANLVKFSLNATIKDVNIKTCDTEYDLADLHIRDLECQVLVKPTKTSLFCGLKDLYLKDCSPQAIYPNIIMIEKSNLFELEFIHYYKNRGKNKKNLDYRIRLRVAQLQVVCLAKFFWDLTRFFEPIISPTVIEETKASVTRSVSKKVNRLNMNRMHISFNFDVFAPILLIPKHSKSTDLLYVKLGHLRLRNFFEMTKDPTQEWNHIFLNLSSIKVSRAELSLADDVYNIVQNILEQVNLKADIKQALHPQVSSVQYDISGQLDLVKINFIQKDIQLLIGIYQENLSEGAPSISPVAGYHSPVKEISHLASATPVAGSRESLKSLSAPYYPAINLNFTLDGMVLCLIEQKSTELGFQELGLSRFQMGRVTIKGNQKNDGSAAGSLQVKWLMIDDICPDSKAVVKRVLKIVKSKENSDGETLPVLNINYKNSGDGCQKVDMSLKKLRFHICPTYLSSLLKFINGSIETNYQSSVDSSVKPTTDNSKPTILHPNDTSNLTISCKIADPEIIFFADPEKRCSPILVLRAGLRMEYFYFNLHETVQIDIHKLQFISCYYGQLDDSCNKIIYPCDMTFDRVCDYQKKKTEMNCEIDKIYMHMSASVLNLMQNVMESYPFWKEQLPYDNSLQDFYHQPHTNLWDVEKATSEKWLEWTAMGGPSCIGKRFVSAGEQIEKFCIRIGELNAVFEVENQDTEIPLLFFKTSLDARIQNWSTQLQIQSELKLELAYFNEKLSVWEPLIEPVMEKENIYQPWELQVKLVQAASQPITTSYEETSMDIADGLEDDVHSIRQKSRVRSSSSESETDSNTEMTVIRRKPSKKKRLASERSFDSVSHQSSVQGESDSEPETFIHNITNKLGNIFSSDSSEADVSETDDNDEAFDPSLNDPVFMTSKGLIHAGMSGSVTDEIDCKKEEESDANLCNYIIINSKDIFQLNLTPAAISVISDVAEALMSPAASKVALVKNLAALEIVNELGCHAVVTVHHSIKNPEQKIKGCSVVQNIDVNGSVEKKVVSSPDWTTSPDDDETDGLSFLPQALSNLGRMVTFTAAQPFADTIENLMSTALDKNEISFQFDGFEPITLSYVRACHKLIPMTPVKNNTKYCFVWDVDIYHGRKLIKVNSPLKVQNNLTMSLDIFCKSQALKAIPELAIKAELDDDKGYVKLTTVGSGESYQVPMLIAYHCELFVTPSDLAYNKTESGIWWKDLIQVKDRCKHYICKPTGLAKPFSIKVTCKDQEPLRPFQSLPKSIPYYILHINPPVVLHNLLPYDIQFSLEGTNTYSSLTHGESTPLYTVDVTKGHKLHLQITDYLSCDWSGNLDISSDNEEFKAITMETETDMESCEKHLSLSIHSLQTLSHDLRIYSPYWLINKTEFPIMLRGSGSDAVFECSSSGLPVLFRYKKHRRKKAKLHVYDSKWSHSFSMDTVNSAGVIICNDKERNRKYQFMMQVQLSKLKLTKIVTILPYFLVVNNSKSKLRFMEENEDADLWLDLPPAECVPYWPVTDSYKIYVKYDNSNNISQHIPIKTIHTTVLRMEHGTGLCVEVAGGTQTPINITFTDYAPGTAPARIENLCDDIFIKIHQKNQSQVTLLSPNQAVLYTWDDPASERTLMWNVCGGKKPSFPACITKDGYGDVHMRIQSLCVKSETADYNDMEDSSPEDDSDEPDGLLNSVHDSFQARTRSDKVVVYWMSFLDGHQRVLLFTRDERVASAVRQMNQAEQTNYSVVLSLDSMIVSVVNTAYKELMVLSISNCPAIWEVEVNNKWKLLNIELQTWLEEKWKNNLVQVNLYEQIEVDLSKMTMTKPYMGALRRTYSPALLMLYRQSKNHKAIHVKIQRLQIDNQLPDAYFPTVLYPLPVPSYILRKVGPKPFIEFVAMRQTIPEKKVDNVRNIKLLMQEFNLKLDKGFMLSVLDFFKQEEILKESSQFQSDLLVAQRSLREVGTIIGTSEASKIFFEYLHLSPLKLHVSFSLNGVAHVAHEVPSTFTSDILDFFLSSVGVTLTEVKDVELRMAYFDCKGVMLSPQQLLAQIQSHYISQAIQQAYVLILGLDVLGNPYGLIRDFTQGLGDLFYEPFLGAIQGTDEFTEGLVHGVQSLLGHTVGSVAGSVSLMTGSLGNALAALSFDSDYKKKRRTRVLQHHESLPETLSLATRGFIHGVALGLSGIILDPIKGVHEDGVEGFFKGCGKGLMGLLTKPSGGIIDMVNMAFDGLRRASELEGGVMARMRLPRFINPSMGLKPYSPYQAIGVRLLQTIRKGQYLQSDMYWAHAPLSREDRSDVFLITDKHLFLLEKNRLWGDWNVEWEVPIDSLLGIPAIVDNRLVFRIKRDDSSLNLFSSGERDIVCNDNQVLTWIQKRIENVIKYRQQ